MWQHLRNPDAESIRMSCNRCFTFHWPNYTSCRPAELTVFFFFCYGHPDGTFSFTKKLLPQSLLLAAAVGEMPASVTRDGRGSDPAWVGLRKADKQVAAVFCVLTVAPFASVFANMRATPPVFNDEANKGFRSCRKRFSSTAVQRRCEDACIRPFATFISIHCVRAGRTIEWAGCTRQC